MRSQFLKLNMADFMKGLLVAVISAVVTYLYEAVQVGSLTVINWSEVGFVGLVAMLSYLMKNLVTNSDSEPLKTERKY